MKKNKEQLINNVIGQLEGIKKMMKGERGEKDCFDVLIQMKAAKSSFERVMIEFLGESLSECSTEIDEQKREKFNKLLKEVIKI